VLVHAMLEPVLLIGSIRFAEFDLYGDATTAKPLDDSARKDTQAWFFGWLRAGVQHDERPLAKLDVIVKNTSRANLAVYSPDHSSDMLWMREELASLDAKRRQDMATTWVQPLSG
jgi:hypothetical protein